MTIKEAIAKAWLKYGHKKDYNKHPAECFTCGGSQDDKGCMKLNLKNNALPKTSKS